MRRTAITWGSGLALFLVGYLVLLPHLYVPTTLHHHWITPWPQVFEGVIKGLTYGMLGVGLVLIYRTNRIINFAHGQIGAFGAVLFFIAVHEWGIPFWVALLPVLALTGGVGAASEAIVIRRLRKAPLVMSVVATLGVGQFLVLLAGALDSKAGAGVLYPTPPGLPSFRVGHLLITQSYVAMLILSPVVVAAVGLFLRFSRYGIALRCAASNPEAARMAGIFASRMSSLAWGIGGALAGLTAILTAPGTAFASAASFGPSLLLRALVCAVIGRMSSMPIALGAGALLGAAEQVMSANYPNGGQVEVLLFVLILGALLLQKQRVGRGEEKGSWASVQGLAPVPARLRELWSVRALGPVTGLVGLAALLVLPLLIDNSNSIAMVSDFGFVIVGISIGIITGLGGQLSLGQFAIAAVGGIASFHVASRTGSYVESFVYAGLASALVSVLIGIPALRVRGLLLTVTTLSFSLVMPAWLLQQDWAFGTGVEPGRPIVFGTALNTGHQYYFFGLAILVVALLLARNIRRGGVGRLLVAVRDNEDAARAFTVRASLVKVQGFALAGFIAGIGGAMYGHSLSLLGQQSYPAGPSLLIVEMVVIGGLGILSGPILGAIVVLGVNFIPLDATGLAVVALLQLIIIMYLPGGLAQLVAPVRDWVIKGLGRRAGVDVEAAYLEESGSGAATSSGPVVDRASIVLPRARPRRSSGPLLEATGLVKSFGGVRAVRGVTLQVERGETLGLIGPNGAGKTTSFELLAGFTKPDAGSVRLHGRDVTALGPEARARMGLIRSFQDAALFPTMTVQECVQLSLERRDPNSLWSDVAGLRGQERRKEVRARELVAYLGLDRYRSAQIQTLSTGTRRITEIACLVGLEPELLLLDEPASGVAQRETEALTQLLLQLKRELDLTLVIIEHDIPMIMEISDRIICMADGQIIAQGAPDVVRNDPRVVESYLGGSITAIERSGAAPSTPAKPPRRRTGTPTLAGSTS